MSGEDTTKNFITSMLARQFLFEWESLFIRLVVLDKFNTKIVKIYVSLKWRIFIDIHNYCPLLINGKILQQYVVSFHYTIADSGKN